MNITIDTGVFDTPQAEEYFTKADHRILCGCRAALEMLGIPLPDWAQRKPTGPKPGHRIMAAYRADNPETLAEATMRKSREAASRLPSNPEQAPAQAPDEDEDPLVTAPISLDFLNG